MSIPKNHHYISQAHIKNFFNKEKKEIYLFDKDQNRHFKKNTTKSIFSEKNLNTKRTINDEYDYSTIEEELNQNFEKDFPGCVEIVKKLVETDKLDDDAHEALLYLAGYGLIAELRTPARKRETDNALKNGMKIIMEMGTEELKSAYKRHFDFNDEVKYSNNLDYIKFAHDVINAMGDLILSVDIPENENDYFILPDFGAATMRGRINNYFNPDALDRVYIGLPLTSKLYLHFSSSKLKSLPRPPGIHRVTTNHVYYLNKENYDYSRQIIACENEHYLQDFVRKINPEYT
ncbi:DUF4238 domain-containing protein [Chryseobacterium pennipullorum]|uniref:DUF4238 domain-containing protein n=1 Tax=Chryseobacterium pennipullorum TaxID=2258963 RepID=A0A3D9BA55_9FLAO|nr:DUF4238 domain-containing protein [Chryseobacterium pennipullorum]REC50228.1 hypothetical protein DRF67_01465 [Chryseobacterium pennipullorum]